MSKHILDTTDKRNRPITVEMGWDKPLQYFYLTIFARDVPDDQDDLLEWSNFIPTDPDKVPAALLYTLDEYGVAVPKVMIEETLDDYRHNRVNRIEVYTSA